MGGMWGSPLPARLKAEAPFGPPQSPHPPERLRRGWSLPASGEGTHPSRPPAPRDEAKRPIPGAGLAPRRGSEGGPEPGQAGGVAGEPSRPDPPVPSGLGRPRRHGFTFIGRGAADTASGGGSGNNKALQQQPPLSPPAPLLGAAIFGPR